MGAKDRGFVAGGRVGSWLGLASALCGTAYLFASPVAAHGRTAQYWTALCLAGPMLVGGGWLAGRFAGAYLGELCGSGRREQVGFFAGGLVGLFIGEAVAAGVSSRAGRCALWFMGSFIGAGVGRSLSQSRPKA